MRRIGMILPLLAILLTQCSSNGGAAAPEDNPETDAERFNAVVLKSDIEALPSGVRLVSADKGDLDYTLSFSNGKQMNVGLHYSAVVTVDAEDYITVNGKSSGHKIVGIPYYTLSSDGVWMKDGVSTGDSAIPSCPDQLLSSGPVMRWLSRDRDGCEVFFSDGTSLSFPNNHGHEMYVSKTASEMDIFIGEENDSSFICYPFKKRHKDFTEGVYPSFLDNWGVMALKLCHRKGNGFTSGTELFLNGEAEMALRVTDGVDAGKGTYVCGTLHGFEQISVSEAGQRQLSIDVDGEKLPENGSFALRKADKIVITQESLIYQAYTNSNPFGSAVRTWTFENGRLTIDITLTVLRDMYSYDMMFGMLCVLRRWEGSASSPYLTRYAIKDNIPYTVHDLQDGWSGSIGSRDSGTRKITEYGEMGWSFALAVDETSHGGEMFVGTNGNAYNKIYFDMAHNYNAAAGEKFHGRVHWEIRRTR